MDQISVGVGARLTDGAWRYGIAYMLDYFVPRDIKNSTTSPPTNARVSGLSQIPTIEVSAAF
jgi:hypothetical protein